MKVLHTLFAPFVTSNQADCNLEPFAHKSVPIKDTILRFNIISTIGDQLDALTYLVACHC